MRDARTLLGLLALGAVVAGSTPAKADDTDPIPILPARGILAPGPRRLGLDGRAADPSTIGNFRGLVGLAYLRGKARDTSGRRWVMLNDIRVLRGDYVATDGVLRSGAFVFV
jgi:hypothetical protein